MDAMTDAATVFLRPPRRRRRGRRFLACLFRTRARSGLGIEQQHTARSRYHTAAGPESTEYYYYYCIIVSRRQNKNRVFSEQSSHPNTSITTKRLLFSAHVSTRASYGWCLVTALPLTMGRMLYNAIQ